MKSEAINILVVDADQTGASKSQDPGESYHSCLTHGKIKGRSGDEREGGFLPLNQ